MIDKHSQTALVVELKDGDTCDTKKAQGELESMTILGSWVGDNTGYRVSLHFCCFNQTDKTAIMVGAKGRFSEDHVLTGEGLCGLIRVDYSETQEIRENDARIGGARQLWRMS